MLSDSPIFLKKVSTLLGFALLTCVVSAAPGPMKKSLDWKQLKFAVSSQQVDGQWSYVLQPKGLAASNEVVQQKIQGPLVSAQIADLDQDGWPEILVSWESGADRQSAALFSVNRGKSLSEVGFPSGENTGFGQFLLQDGHLVRRDPDTIETHYRLAAGEALKQLVAEKDHPSPLDFGFPRGFSTQKMDLKANPRKDFQAYASGNWYKRSKLPADMLKFSGPALVLKVVNSQIRTVLEDAQQRSPKAKKGTPLQQVGDFYASGMDTDRLDKLGVSPIKAELDKLASIDSASKLSESMIGWSGRLNDVIGYNILVSTDQQDRDKISIYLGESELGMSLDNYTKPQFANLRKAYLQKLQSTLELYGVEAGEAKAQAQAYFDTELRMAAKKLTPAQRRDPNNSFRKMSFKEAQAAYPNFDLAGQLAHYNIPTPDYIWVLMPAAVAERHAIIAEGNWKLLRENLRLQILLKCSPFLGSDFGKVTYKYVSALYGSVPDAPRTSKVIYQLTHTFGHPLSQLYVGRYFPAERRKSVEDLLRRIRGEFRQRIVKNQWLEPETRRQALEKLDAIQISVGYPDDWIDHTSVDIRRDDFIGNVFRVNQFLTKRDMARFGKPVKVDRFTVPGSTLPIDVNAAYSSDSNKIEIPAAFLQPPFFDPQADMPVNLGTLGAVIGHELTHGFDSGGRQYDAKGNVRDWWTAADGQHFIKENAKLVEQANKYLMLPGMYLNGELESGENMADAGGVALGYAALQTWLKEHPEGNKLKDGLTPEQRYFVAWAQLWSEKGKDSVYRQLNVTDGHPPGQYRQSQPMRHESGFFKTFDIRPGDPLWLDENKRIHIW